MGDPYRNVNQSAMAQFQSIQGPTDPSLRHSEIEGYQPVSRIGEVVMNCFGTPHTRTPTHTYTCTHSVMTTDSYHR